MQFFFADVVMAALGRAKNTYRTISTSSDEAELGLNEGFHEVHQLVAATASAQRAFPCGSGDRTQVLGARMQTLEMVQNEDVGSS